MQPPRALLLEPASAALKSGTRLADLGADARVGTLRPVEGRAQLAYLPEQGDTQRVSPPLHDVLTRVVAWIDRFDGSFAKK